MMRWNDVQFHLVNSRPLITRHEFVLSRLSQCSVGINPASTSLLVINDISIYHYLPWIWKKKKNVCTCHELAWITRSRCR